MITTIDIKDISGLTKLTVLISEGCFHRYELMKEDYVQLVFSLETPVAFRIGDYIEYEGEKYYITGNSYPTYNATTGGVDYTLRFDSHYYRWQNHILFYDRQGNREASWSLTRAPEAHLGIVVSNLRSIGFDYNGQEYQAVVDSSVDAVAKLVTYDNTNIIDALTKIAEAWECEWWVEGRTIYIGRLEQGEPVDLEIGKEIATMSRTQSQDIYATRLYVFGGTRNIPSNYREGQTGVVVDGVVQKRLMLPVGTPYIDVVSGLSDEQVVEAVVVFDDIYPRYVGTMSEVKTVQRSEETEEGETGATFTAYQFKDATLSFSSEYILPGATLRMQFQTGPLSGMEFDVTFNPNEIEDESDPAAQVFEIVRNDDYGQYLPQDPLIPAVGNQYILYNFDTQYVNDALIPEAEQELLDKANAYKPKVTSDPSTYTLNMNSYRASGFDENNGTLNPEKEIDLTPGQKVNMINQAYFTNGRVSRIIGYQKKLDYPYDAPTYTVGETAAYSRFKELEQKIDSIQYEGNTYINQGGGGSAGGMYVITSNDTTAASDNNLFSALRTLQEINKLKGDMNGMYLRKDINDTAHGIILFEQKIGSYLYTEGWDGKGWEIEAGGAAELDSLRVRSDIFLGNRLGSDTFVSGFPNGYGWEITPYKRLNAAEVEETKYRLEIDDIIVRGKLKVFEMVISQLRGENDNVIFAGMMRVDHYDNTTRRIYLDTDEGVMYNPFRSGDILMVQRFGGMPTAENDYNVIKQYELRVDEAGIGDLSDGEKRLDWITFTNFVGDLEDITEGDILTRVDSVTDSTRKGIVKVTTIDEIGAPYIDVVYGMKTDPENATKARMGNLTEIRTKSGIDLTGVWGIYGNGAYFENSTYIMEDGNTIEQNFSIINGKLESTIGEIRNDMSLEAGNILKNSTFSQNTNYWETSNEVHFLVMDGVFLYMNSDTFLSEKGAVADIYQDGGRNVLRIRRSTIKQKNEVMDIPVHEDGDTDWTYSFSFYYRVLQSGTLTAGFKGSQLYLTKQLEPSDTYQKISLVGDWNEQGDFEIAFTGEILIYSVSLFNDELADAIIRLETGIEQTAEEIKLWATEQIESTEGEIYQKYDAELSIQAQEISQRVTYTEYEEGTNNIKTELESELSVQAGQISGISTEVDNINHTISTAGWITASDGNTLFASKSLEDGDEIISYINQTATSTTIKSSRIDLVGAVTFNMFSSSLKSDFNSKLESGDMGDLAFKNEVSSGDLSYSLSNQIANMIDIDDLNSKLSNYPQKGAITKGDLVSSLQSEINGKLTGSATTSSGKLSSVIINGQILIAGGYMQADFINTDTILANAAYIGNFQIESGWFKCNANPSSDVGYIDMRGTNTRVAFGRDLIPGVVGGAYTCTAIISNKNNASYGGNTYGLDVSASGSYSNDVHAVAVNCNGGLRVVGEYSVIENLFTNTNTNISNSSCSSAKNLRYARTFVFQPTAYTSVYLPDDDAISSEFGYFSDGRAVVDHSAIYVRILITKWATDAINVQSTIDIVDQDGNTVRENSSVSRSNFDMRKGDFAELMYYNRTWYIVQLHQ